MKTKTTIFFFIIFLVAQLNAQNSGLLTQIDNCIEAQVEQLPAEKIYVHTDRTFYQPGETVWFKTYLTNAANQYLKTKSQVVYVQLVSPSGTILKQLVLNNQNGVIHGDFQIQNNYAGGIYQIKAYTNWLGNFGEDAIFEKEINVQKSVLPKLLMNLEFEKEAYGKGARVAAVLKIRDLQDNAIANHSVNFTANIQGNSPTIGTAKTDANGTAIVQFELPEDLNSADGLLNIIVQHGGFTESISRSIPIVLQNIDLQFFPEGGDLITGFSNKIAFKALDEFGEPADVSGIILNENGAEVTTFQSFHDGMGTLSLSPRLNQKLTAKITQPQGIETIFQLPEVSNNYLGASLQNEDDENLSLSIFSSKSGKVVVTLRMHEQVYFSTNFKLERGKNTLDIPIKNLPVGIAQITIFNQKDEPQWERLAFVNQQRELKIEVKTDKETYQPRDQITMNVTVQDETGKGVQGNFSLAVVDDKLHSFADDKQPNILAQLLVQSELRGEVHEPNFYFDKTEEKAETALDLVMLTNGWRRFAWQEMLTNSENDWEKKAKFQPEKLMISGQVNLNGQPVFGAKVWTTDKENFVTTNAAGQFEIAREGAKMYGTIFTQYKKIKSQGRINGFKYKVVGTRFQPGGAVVIETDDVLKDLYADEKEVEIIEEEIMVEMPVATMDFASKKKLKRNQQKDIMMPEGTMLSSAEIKRRPIRGVNALAASTAGVSMDEVVVVGYGVEGQGNAFYDMDIDVDFQKPQLYVYTNYNQATQFHRSRQFYSPRYPQNRKRGNQPRSDFRKTLFWNANLQTNAEGKSAVTFFASDEVTTFRAILEGIGNGGKVGRSESTFTVNMPFSMTAKLPKTVTFGDKMLLPIVLKNSTDEAISGTLEMMNSNSVFTILNQQKETLTIPVNGFLEAMIEVQVGAEMGEFPVHLAFASKDWKDEVQEIIEVTPKGFPREISVSGKEKERAFSFNIEDFISGSLEANFVAFPDLTMELMSGVESMLREPNGCFEQTSSSSYPNTLVLQYLENQQIVNPDLRNRATGYLERGYKRLAGYEIKGGGFSLFGHAPADPLITAYGLLQFNDLKKVWNGVDEAMMKRAEIWLFSALKRMNMTGSVDDAYFLYALSESGYTNFGNNLKVVNENALKTKEPYLLALACHLNLNLGHDEIADEMLGILMENFKKDKFKAPAVAPSLSHSRGTARALEITALVARAQIQLHGNTGNLVVLMNELNQHRKNGGRFGSTQTTIQCLKTMNDYAAILMTTKEGGDLEISINKEVVETLEYEAGHQGKIEFPDLGQYFGKGKNTVQVRFKNTKNPLPYVLDVYWKNNKPDSDPNALLKLETTLSNTAIKSGETARLTATIHNKTSEDVYAPMVLIGIPAGLSLQPWQLKEMLDQQVFDYYELRGNYLIAYFKNFKKDERRTLNLDLKADIPGDYFAPASVAYPYYQEEAKDWVKGTEVTIR